MIPGARRRSRWDGLSVWDRLWAKVERGDKSECWPWIGRSTHRFGYGVIATDRSGRMQTSSRVAYELLFGAVSRDLVVCHRCDNPPCCNPWHMFVGTKGDNYRDASAKGRAVHGYQAWTHCKRGHELSGENLRITVKGHRICRTCQRMRGLIYDRARRAKLQTTGTNI